MKVLAFQLNVATGGSLGEYLPLDWGLTQKNYNGLEVKSEESLEERAGAILGLHQEVKFPEMDVGRKFLPAGCMQQLRISL